MSGKNILEIIQHVPGKVIQNDFDLINESTDLKNQQLVLSEDMLQIEVSDQITFDIGWYSKPNGNGTFIVFIIKDEDWESPLFKKKCYSLKTLKKAIAKCAEMLGSTNI
jgi:hypothetical protein